VKGAASAETSSAELNSATRARINGLSSFPAPFRGTKSRTTIREGSLYRAILEAEYGSVSEADHRADCLAPLLVGDADDGHVRDGRVRVERVLHFGRIHILTTGDHHVFEAVDDNRYPSSSA
jgi:hypothetical protein